MKNNKEIWILETFALHLISIKTEKREIICCFYVFAIWMCCSMKSEPNERQSKRQAHTVTDRGPITRHLFSKFLFLLRFYFISVRISNSNFYTLLTSSLCSVFSVFSFKTHSNPNCNLLQIFYFILSKKYSIYTHQFIYISILKRWK